MARTKVDPAVVRPTCPQHPGSRVRLDGFRHCVWRDAHRRPRCRSVTETGTRGHSFSLPVAVRQPTERHPDSGTACPTCEHVYGRHEGVRTGRGFLFGQAEIARLLVRVGEGMSLRAASRRWRARAEADHLIRVKERLAERYAAELDVRTVLGLPTPPSGRPRRSMPRAAASVRGRTLAEYPDLVLEWAWDVNVNLDPARLAAGSHERVAWRCLLDPAHVWETKVADRTYHDSACPYHMGVRVHPAESLAAYYPWLASEWHPTRNELRPDQVTRASARDVVWRCEAGHTWTAAVYQRTLSGTGCPDCYRLDAAARSRAGKARARRKRDTAELAKVIALPPRAAGGEAG